MKFPVGYALSFSFQHQDIDCFVQGDPAGELCITCHHPVFVQRFSGGTKCFDPFVSAFYIPDPSDENYDFFTNLKLAILKASSELPPRES